jgi:predicted enzyme related to lactoylglutathione lyase
MELPNAPVPSEGFLVTHFLTVSDQARAREFYTGVFGGKVLAPENPCVIKLANSWIILNTGGGPTPDKPDVTLESPRDPTHVSSFLNLRVADIRARYAEWKAKGAEFITAPLDNRGWETRCYIRDPDGYIIEVGESSPKMIELFRRHET